MKRTQAEFLLSLSADDADMVDDLISDAYSNGYDDGYGRGYEAAAEDYY